MKVFLFFVFGRLLNLKLGTLISVKKPVVQNAEEELADGNSWSDFAKFTADEEAKKRKLKIRELKNTGNYILVLDRRHFVLLGKNRERKNFSQGRFKMVHTSY